MKNFIKRYYCVILGLLVFMLLSFLSQRIGILILITFFSVPILNTIIYTAPFGVEAVMVFFTLIISCLKLIFLFLALFDIWKKEGIQKTWKLKKIYSIATILALILVGFELAGEFFLPQLPLTVTYSVKIIMAITVSVFISYFFLRSLQSRREPVVDFVLAPVGKIIFSIILLFLFLLFYMAPTWVTSIEIEEKESADLRTSEWKISYRGKINTRTKTLSVYKDKLYALREYPPTLEVYDGTSWREVRTFQTDMTGMTASSDFLLVFGSKGYGQGMVLYRFDGLKWMEIDMAWPSTGWEPRITWWNGKLYMIGTDFALYSLEDSSCVYVSTLPWEAVDQVRKSHDVRGANLTVYQGKLFVIVGKSLFIFEDGQWSGVAISDKFLYETSAMKEYKDKLIMAGYGGGTTYAVIFDGSSVTPLSSKTYRGIKAVEVFDDKLFMAALQDWVWIYDGKTMAQDISFPKEVQYQTDDRVFKQASVFTLYRNKLYVGGLEGNSNIYVYSGN